MSSDAIQPSDIDLLIQYVHAGMRLPMTEEEYCTRLKVSGNTANKISSDIGPLVAIYSPASNAHSECLTFYIDTYPATCMIASAILIEAQRAILGSEYDEIVQAIKNLDQATSDEERQKLQKIIMDTIDAEVKTLDDDRKQLQEVLNGLTPFMQLTVQHNHALSHYNGTLDNIVSTEGNTLLDLQSTLDHLRAQAAQTGGAEYAALLVQIADYERKLSDQQAVVDALVTIRVDLLRTLELLGPATLILMTMVGGWSLSDDALGSVHDMVDSDLRNASSVIVDRVLDKLLGKWTELREQVQGYPQA
ncbi:hypothetical protein EV714DRAFT_275951 [Schizophyllum commune]